MKNLTKSQEKYLLAINELSKNNQNIKVKDVSNYLKIALPSCAEIIKILKEKDYINYEPYQNISLKPKAKEVVEIKEYRKNTIERFLIEVLEIDSSLAQKNSENIEFSMPEIILERFVHFLDFMTQCSCNEPKWIKSCKNTLKNGKISDKCKNCMISNEKSCCCGGCNE